MTYFTDLYQLQSCVKGECRQARIVRQVVTLGPGGRSTTNGYNPLVFSESRAVTSRPTRTESTVRSATNHKLRALTYWCRILLDPLSSQWPKSPLDGSSIAGVLEGPLELEPRDCGVWAWS